MADSGHARTDTVTSVASDITVTDSRLPPLPPAVPLPIVAPIQINPALPPIPPPIEGVIPPTHPFRTLVLCFDGTGDQFDADNSNVVKFFSMLKKDDRSRQMVYYQSGIGTYTKPTIATPLAAEISKKADEAVAWNLDVHVMEGYEFLMQNYTAGDRICIFGFSRGAYTARGLAGMIHKVGLLPASNKQQIPFAYKMFTNTSENGWKQSNGFKKAFAIDVDIEFIGVWDTVNSVGIIPRTLPFTTSNTIVKTFRHAVALDERRAKFKANLWNRPTEHESTLSVTDQEIEQKKIEEAQAVPVKPVPAVKSSTVKTAASSGTAGKKKQPAPASSSWFGTDEYAQQVAFEKAYSKDRATPTDIEEVWFAGCHCDVGGGSVSDDTQHNLARIPLRWMIRECFKTKSGIMFETAGLKSIGLDPVSLFPEVLPRPPAMPAGDHIIQAISDDEAIKKSPQVQAWRDDASLRSEEGQDMIDALCPIYDQLSLQKGWWLLEVFPLKFPYQREDNSWSSYIGFNLGGGREIPDQERNGVRVHRSVKTRLDAHDKAGKKYEPNAKLDLKRVTWVD